MQTQVILTIHHIVLTTVLYVTRHVDLLCPFLAVLPGKIRDCLQQIGCRVKYTKCETPVNSNHKEGKF